MDGRLWWTPANTDQPQVAKKPKAEITNRVLDKRAALTGIHSSMPLVVDSLGNEKAAMVVFKTSQIASVVQAYLNSLPTISDKSDITFY